MPDHSLAVIVLAAGQGTRFKSQLPKVLHRLAGIPLIGHVLATAEALRPHHIAVVVRHERDQVAGHIQEQIPGAIIVDQDELPGTGRAVEQALAALPPSFAGHVVILSGDVPLLDATTLQALIEEHITAQSALSVVTAEIADPSGFGRILRDSDNLLDAIVEHKDASPEQLLITEVNAGVYIASVQELAGALSRIGTENAQHEKYLTDAVKVLKEQGARVVADRIRDPWLVSGINDRFQLSEVAAELNARIIKGWQLAGVTVQDPKSTWIDINVTLEPDVEILPDTQLLGATRVSSGAVIGPDTTLRDTEVGGGAVVVRTDATLAVIGAGATVGPFAYLRPGTYLESGGKIGTFVETKNARIGVNSKVPHLSYIGDAVIGTGTNIGAGTITANYDGEKKHKTVVGDYSKTGAHNTFVAPVEIGDGVYTAAGTVVRKDVPSGSLAMTLASQKNVAGWVEQHRPGSKAALAATAAAEAGAATGADSEEAAGTATATTGVQEASQQSTAAEHEEKR